MKTCAALRHAALRCHHAVLWSCCLHRLLLCCAVCCCAGLCLFSVGTMLWECSGSLWLNLWASAVAIRIHQVAVCVPSSVFAGGPRLLPVQGRGRRRPQGALPPQVKLFALVLMCHVFLWSLSSGVEAASLKVPTATGEAVSSVSSCLTCVGCSQLSGQATGKVLHSRRCCCMGSRSAMQHKPSALCALTHAFPCPLPLRCVGPMVTV